MLGLLFYHKLIAALGCSTKSNKENYSILCSDLRVKEAYLINTLKRELNAKYGKIKSAENLECEEKQASQSKWYHSCKLCVLNVLYNFRDKCQLKMIMNIMESGPE